jgi:hypothetical protein
LNAERLSSRVHRPPAPGVRAYTPKGRSFALPAKSLRLDHEGVEPVAVVVTYVFPSTEKAMREEPDALVEGQELQKAGKRLEARDRFALCGRSTCPAEIVQACARWSREVEDALPSVVVAARDRQRHDLTDARVPIDGKPGVDVSARAIPLDPGPHRFTFQQTGSPDVEQQALLRDGEKNRDT